MPVVTRAPGQDGTSRWSDTGNIYRVLRSVRMLNLVEFINSYVKRARICCWGSVDVPSSIKTGLILHYFKDTFPTLCLWEILRDFVLL